MSTTPGCTPSVPWGASEREPRRPLPPARVAHHRVGGGVWLEPVPLTQQARFATRRVIVGAAGALRATLGACVAVIDRGLRGGRWGAQRVLWWLGYAEIDDVEPPYAPPALARSDEASTPSFGSRWARERSANDDSDDVVTGVYRRAPFDGSPREPDRSPPVPSRPATEDEITNVARGGNVIALADHRAGR